MAPSNVALAAQLPHWSAFQNNTAKSWWKDAGLRQCMLNVIILYGAVFAYGYDGSLIGTLQVLPLWGSYFDHPMGIRLGLFAASYLFPQLPFPFLGSYISDRFGRKPVIAIASFLGIVGPLVSGLGHNTASFIVGRIITGVSSAFYFISASPLIAEVAHPRFRAVCQASFYGTYFVGAFTAGWIGFGCVTWNGDWSWRLVTILQGLGCVPLMAWSLTPWMAESPRWLVKQGRREEARTILAKLHANGDVSDELVHHEMAEIVIGVDLDDVASKSSYKDFTRTPGNRKRLGSVLWFAWALSMSGNNLLAYYLPIILGSIGFHDLLQVQGIQAGQFAFLFFVSLLGAQLVERIGRKKLLLGGCAFAIVMFSIFCALTATFAKTYSQSVAYAAVPILFLFAGSFVVWLFPLPFLYLPEILPYHLRSKGMAIYTLVTNAGALYNALVNPIALDAIGWKYYVMFICLDIVELVIAWFLIVETKGLALEEIAVLFDGIDAPVAINEAPYNGVPYEGHAVSAEKEKEKEKDEFIEEHV